MAYDWSGNSFKIISKSSVYNGPAVKTYFFFYTSSSLANLPSLYVFVLFPAAAPSGDISSDIPKYSSGTWFFRLCHV